MRHGRPSEEQLRRNFDSVLTAVLSGRGVRTETGLDHTTQTALWAIARARPKAPNPASPANPPEAPEALEALVAMEALVAAARRAFAGQLDGTNAAAWRAEMDRRIAARGADPTP
ncbi:hypothetical protein ACIQWR_24965 [Streptomyces sp. NPDC098789]|uniref:hypothetical protein n=1 Tax=Streptomyces sp. NPDC098789 TaxID=3366098 RepID=UPI0038079CC3